MSSLRVSHLSLRVRRLHVRSILRSQPDYDASINPQTIDGVNSMQNPLLIVRMRSFVPTDSPRRQRYDVFHDGARQEISIARFEAIPLRWSWFVGHFRGEIMVLRVVLSPGERTATWRDYVTASSTRLRRRCEEPLGTTEVLYVRPPLQAKPRERSKYSAHVIGCFGSVQLGPDGFRTRLIASPVSQTQVLPQALGVPVRPVCHPATSLAQLVDSYPPRHVCPPACQTGPEMAASLLAAIVTSHVAGRAASPVRVAAKRRRRVAP